MPKKPPAIKWRNIDSQELEQARRKYNNQIYNRRFRHPEERDLLPDTIRKSELPQIREQIQTRQDFKAQISNLKKPIKIDAVPVVSEYGAKSTRQELKNLQSKLDKINTDRAKLRDAYLKQNATLRGKDLGLTRGEMGDERLKNLSPIHFNFDKMNTRDFEKKKETINRLSSPEYIKERQAKYKENYLNALRRNGIDERIINAIGRRAAKHFDNLYRVEELATIDFIYEQNGQKETVENELMNIWNLHINLNDEQENDFDF